MAKSKQAKQRVFLAIFLGTAAAMRKFQNLPTKVRHERETAGMQAWTAWAREHQKSIVEMGGPLGTTKRVGRKGVTNTRNELGAFTVVRAASHAAAAKLFRNHPHFMIFPGDAVEVMEILPVPSM